MAFNELKMSDADKFVAGLTRELMLKIKDKQATEQDVLDYFDKLDETYREVYGFEPVKTIAHVFDNVAKDEAKSTYGAYDRKQIKISKEFIEDCLAGKVNFTELLCVWGHEYGHRTQHALALKYENMSLDEQDKVGDYAKSILSSLKKSRLNFKSFEYMIHAMRPYLSKNHMEFFKTATKEEVEEFFKNLWFSYYVQQKEEEHARNVGFKFASKLLRYVTILPETTEQDRKWLMGQELSEDEYVLDYQSDYHFYRDFIDTYKELDVTSLINIEKIIDNDCKKFENENDALDFKRQSIIVYHNVLNDLLKDKTAEELKDYFMIGVKTACPVLMDVALSNLEYDLVRNKGVSLNGFANQLVYELSSSDTLTEKVFKIDYSKVLSQEDYQTLFENIFSKKRVAYAASMLDSLIGKINLLDKTKAVEVYKDFFTMLDDYVCDYGTELLEALNSGKKDFPYFDYKEYLALAKQMLSIGKYVQEDYFDIQQIVETIEKNDWQFEEMVIPDDVRSEFIKEASIENVPMTEIDSYIERRVNEYVEASSQGRLKRIIYGDAYADKGMKPYLHAPIERKGERLQDIEIYIEKGKYY